MKSSEEQNTHFDKDNSSRSQTPVWERKDLTTRSNAPALERKGLISDIQDLSFQDGPGIRTTIFFKGCPLKCLWCSNPESQNFFTEIMHSEVLCKKSYDCQKVCPIDAIKINNDDNPQFDRNKCTTCEEKPCIESCNSSAIKVAGRFYTTDELINKVLPNKPFYKNSNGGITLSGGEPLAQPVFVKELIYKAIENNISVCLETCGYFNYKEIEDCIDKFDLIYFDLKCIDNKSYYENTGVDEKIILDNLKEIAKENASKIIITIPVIPDINNSVAMMNKVISLCDKSGIKKIRLLPYHSFGRGKYKDLGREYKFNITKDLNPLRLNAMKESAIKSGISCWIE